MTALPVRRRNRTIAAALSGVLVLGAAPTLGVVGWHVLRNSKAGTAAKTYPVVGFPSTPTAMLAVVDDQQLVTALAVLVLAPGTGKGGTLVSFPTNASTAQTAKEQQVPVSDSVIVGGRERIPVDVESLARVSIGSSGVLDEAALAAALAPVGPVAVSLPTEIRDVSADASVQIVVPAGDQQLTPEDAAAALVADDPEQLEVDRLPDVRAIWVGIAAAVGNGINPDAVPALGAGGPADFAEFMTHFLGGPIQVATDLSTDPITGPTNPDKVDVGRIDVPSVVMLMASIAPSAMIAPKPTLNFRIENGLSQADVDAAGLVDTTPVEVTLDLVRRLLFAEGNILSVSPKVFSIESEQSPDKTTIFAEGGLQSAELDVIVNQLGSVEVEDPSFVFPQVNVVIVVGRSYLADIAARAVGGASPASTDVTGASVSDSSISPSVSEPVEPSGTGVDASGSTVSS